jgi:peptide/nickel transport system ATP-binding protein
MTGTDRNTAAADEPLLSIRGLCIEGQTGQGWQPLVRNADLTLARGEVLGLIGESGAGKSTLGLATMGFVRVGCRIASGSIRFDGQELVGAGDETLRRFRGRRVAYVAQSAAASFNPSHRLINQTVEAPLYHGITDRSAAIDAAIGLYREMQLPEPDTIGFRYPHQVSGGQLQRMMTAMAMACRPDLIIFDEPTTALDVTTQIEVLAAIRNIVQAHGAAAIYITHDLAVVAQMADRIKVLLRGSEVEEAPTRQMVAAPAHDYTRSLWAVRSFRRPAQPAPSEGAVPIVELRGVTAGYGRLDVLRDIDIALHPGRTTAVVGESGSGKSTAARVITGLLPARSGEIRFEGRPLAASFRQRSKEELRQVQMIYQMADTALNPKVRLREIIGYPARFYLGLRGRALDARVREILSTIGLEPDAFIDRFPGELSGGQKQRIGIARALAAEPRCIICDEVTSALDQLVAEDILKLLDRLQQEFSLSYMFITHDLSTVRAIADDVVVMQNGVIVEKGPKSAIFETPQEGYTRLLLSSLPQLDCDWLDRVLEERGGRLDLSADR